MSRASPATSAAAAPQPHRVRRWATSSHIGPRCTRRSEIIQPRLSNRKLPQKRANCTTLPRVAAPAGAMQGSGIALSPLLGSSGTRGRPINGYAACAALVLAVFAVLAQVERQSPVALVSLRAAEPAVAPMAVLQARRAEQRKVAALRAAIDQAKGVQVLPPQHLSAAKALDAGKRLLQDDLEGKRPARSTSLRVKQELAKRGVARQRKEEARLNAESPSSAAARPPPTAVEHLAPPAGEAVTAALLPSMTDNAAASSISQSISGLAQEFKKLEAALSTKVEAKARPATSAPASAVHAAPNAESPRAEKEAADKKEASETALMEAIDRAARGARISKALASHAPGLLEPLVGLRMDKTNPHAASAPRAGSAAADAEAEGAGGAGETQPRGAAATAIQNLAVAEARMSASLAALAHVGLGVDGVQQVPLVVSFWPLLAALPLSFVVVPPLAPPPHAASSSLPRRPPPAQGGGGDRRGRGGRGGGGAVRESASKLTRHGRSRV